MENNRIGIFIPTHNNFRYLVWTIESLYETTNLNKIDVIIIDNCSTDQTPKITQLYPSIKYIRLNENRYYGPAINIAVDQFPEYSYYLFTNDDILFTPHWDDLLLSLMVFKNKIGIVGPVSNYVAEEQRVGDIVTLQNYKSYAQMLREQYPNTYRFVGFISGFFMLIRKECWEDVKYFPDDLLTWEDNYICYKAQIKGWELWVHCGCFIYHFGSVTLNKMGGYQRLLPPNFEKYKQLIRSI